MTVDFLMEVDKLVQLIESPIFTCEFETDVDFLRFFPHMSSCLHPHLNNVSLYFLSCPDLRLQLLDVENNPYLIKALYGLLMLLPQSQAFQLLSHRLRCVPNPELMRTVYVCMQDVHTARQSCQSITPQSQESQHNVKYAMNCMPLKAHPHH